MNLLGKLRGLVGQVLESVREAPRQIGDFVDRARATREPGVERMLDAGYGEHYLEALGNYRQGIPVHCDDQAVLATFGLATFPAESYLTRQAARDRRRLAVAAMADAGYDSDRFAEDLEKLENGEEIPADHRALLVRFGVVSPRS